MACGKPIISTNANFSKGILRDGVNVLLAQPKCTDKLAKTTIKLLSSEELCKQLGAAARQTAEETMDLEANTDKIEQVYKKAIERWRRAAKTGGK